MSIKRHRRHSRSLILFSSEHSKMVKRHRVKEVKRHRVKGVELNMKSYKVKVERHRVSQEVKHHRVKRHKERDTVIGKA